MKVLILTEDKSIFQPESSAYQDLVHSSQYVDQLHVIVFTEKKDELASSQASGRLFIYPTNSKSSSAFKKDAFAIVQTQLFWKSGLFIDMIIGRDSLSAATVASDLSQKFKRNYILDIYENNFLTNGSKSIIARIFHTKDSDSLVAGASAIRVLSQARGEMISVKNPELEKKIFILPFVSLQTATDQSAPTVTSDTDIHRKFPQFNIILLSVSPTTTAQELKQAQAIMQELRTRYSRIGLILVSQIKLSFWDRFFMPALPDSIVIDQNTMNTGLQYQKPNIYIDIKSVEHTGEEVMTALRAGLPVIASGTSTNTQVIQEGKNGFIVSPTNPQLFARKVIDILETPGLREMMHLYSYDITVLYGTDPEDYYKRLITIWETYKTPEEYMQLEEPIGLRQTSPPAPIQSDFYKAFTVDIAKKVLKRFEKNEEQKRTLSPLRTFTDHEVFDVDSVKIGIEKALLDEITVKNGEMQAPTKEPSLEDQVDVK